MSRRTVIGLLWAVLIMVIIAALTFGTAIAGAALAVHVLPGEALDAYVPFCMVVGAACALIVCHEARGWVQSLRLRRLRRDGVSVTAVVTGVSSHYVMSTRGPGRTIYHVRVRWPGGGSRERVYRFMGRGDRSFERRVRTGAELPVWYPPGRPHRFVIDIPYAPTMADQFV